MGDKQHIPGQVTMTLPVEETFTVTYIENTDSDAPDVILQVTKGTYGLESLKVKIWGSDRVKLLRRTLRVVEAGPEEHLPEDKRSEWGLIYTMDDRLQYASR